MKDRKQWFKVVYAVTAALGVILGIIAAIFSTKNAPRIFEKSAEEARPVKKETTARKKTASKPKKKKTPKK